MHRKTVHGIVGESSALPPRPGNRAESPGAAGPWSRAATEQRAPRSRAPAGSRVDGVPGGGRRRGGAAVPRCRRSAAGPLVVREQQRRRRRSRCPAHSPRPGTGAPAVPAMSSNDGTAGSPLTPACRAAGPFGARGDGGDDKARRFPRVAGRAQGGRCSGRGRRQRDGRCPARAAGRGRPGGLPPWRGPTFSRSGHTGHVRRWSGIESGDIATQCAIAWRYHHSRWRPGPSRAVSGGSGPPDIPFARIGGGAGLARARSGPAGRAGARWRPDQNRIRYPAPLLPAHRPRLRHSSSPRVTGGGPMPARGPARASSPPPPAPPRPPRCADEQGRYGHRGTEPRSGPADIAPRGRRGASISALPLAPPP